MCLIKLTFGNGSLKEYQLGIVNKNKLNIESIADNSADKVGGKIKVIKVAEFFGTDEICIMGELIDGKVIVPMMVNCGEKKGEITFVESKYGLREVSQKGTKLIVMVKGLTKQDIIGEELELSNAAKKPAIKPQGRIIIA